MIRKIGFFLCSFAPLLIAHAQSAVQSGEITMEQDHKTEDSYEAQQETAINFLKKIQTAAANGGSGTIAAPTEPTISYLNVAYLYCSITQGTCPQILDAILEADVINSRSSGNVAACPIMTAFWKLYVRNDMEQRHNHYVKTGFLSTTDDFKKKVRPIYVKCKETVAHVLDSPERASRYTPNSSTRETIAKAIKMTEELKAKVPNLFVSLGAR